MQNLQEKGDVIFSMVMASDVVNKGEFRGGDLTAFVKGQHLLVRGGAPA
jgi:hypothetical protein